MFPDEFATNELSAEIELAKKITEFELNMMSFKLSRVERARLGKEKNDFEKRLEHEIKSKEKTITSTLIEMWQNFDELSLMMSKLEGKMNFKQIQGLPVIDFYKLKSWLHKQQKRTTTNAENE